MLLAQTVSLCLTIENFGKLNDNYYRGAQPLADQFTQLKTLGIKTVIDLRQDSLDKADEWARAAGLQYINIPLTTKRAATEEQTIYFLNLVNDKANWPVYIHCKGGRHRTGEMTAIYRITHDGWSADQAYQEMKKYDLKTAFLPSLTKEVRLFVLQAVHVTEAFNGVNSTGCAIALA